MKKAAFTLIELLIVIGIIAVLAGAMVPVFRSSIEEARATKAVDLADVLREACTRYYFDTGTYAQESSSQPDPFYHGLSQNDGTSGWNGPYIGHVLANSDNPYGGPIVVSMRMPVDFDLNGDTIVDKKRLTNGDVLVFREVPESSGKKINDILDSGIPGDWKETGKVKWSFVFGPGDTFVYLIGGNTS